MDIDVNFLNKFYQSLVGKTSRHLIGRVINKLAGTTIDTNILGVGYANPYLRKFFNTADTIVSTIPSNLGMVRWPRKEPNRAVSCNEDHLPLQNNSFDIVIMVHALEYAESPWSMLAEVNRVLPSGGRVIVVVPNRAGFWSRSVSQPFGNGRPYTKGQLKKIMKSTGFTPIRHSYSLFFPPFKLFAHSKISTFCERWLRFLFNENSGVIIGLYEKQVSQKVKTTSRLMKINPVRGGVVVSPRQSSE